MSNKGIAIPKYSLSEELISAISHGIGALLGIAALVLCVVKGAFNGDPIQVASCAVYGGTLVILYTMSCLYHSFKVNKAKRVFRVIDHCSIYLLIAGTYTPYTLITLRGKTGFILFGIVWACAVLGIILNAIDLRKFRFVSMGLYLIMGWCIITCFPQLSAALGDGVWYLIGGGIAYTVGAILYGIGKKVKYMHSIFHFFVLAGSILHFFSIIFYVL